MSLIALLLMAFLIAVGSVDFSAFSAVGYVGYTSAFNIIVSIIAVCAAFAPLMPLATLALIKFTSFTLRHWQTAALSVTAGVLGSFATLISAAVAGGGSTMTFLHGFALTSIIISSLLLLVNPREAPLVRHIGFYFMICPTVVAIWSLTNAVALAVSAKTIAGAQNFCLARHGDNAAISQLIDLRGLALYTTKSGYKISQSWFFHSVLLVKAGDDLNAYNWSLGKMRFERLPEPKRFLVNPLSDCTPQQNFLQTIPLVRI